jgi:O-antigen ligase
MPRECDAAVGVTPKSHAIELRWFLLVCWVLSVTGLSAPGRAAPLSVTALDPIALMKLGARGIGCAALGLILLRHFQHARTLAITRVLMPLIFFAAWAAASIYWSPIRSITAGHALDLLLLTLLAITAGILCLDEDDYRRIFFHLAAIGVLMSFVLMALNFHAVAAGQRPMDYMQPNDMAKTAGCGLLVLVCCHLLWEWTWTRRLLWPGCAILLFSLYATRSRTALFLTPLALLPLCFRLRGKKTITAICALGGILALIAPYSRTADRLPDTVGNYLARGQSAEELAQLSGRAEMWSIAMKSFEQSPVFGHGYYIMTDTGYFMVWGKQQWQTAHNAYLHILTGLGLVGMVFLAWALGSALRPALASWKDFGRTRKPEFLILIVAAWFCAFGCFELSFFGPIDTAVCTFFVLLGISAARLMQQPAGANKYARSRTA